jgi:DNA ligase (NAD+)
VIAEAIAVFFCQQQTKRLLEKLGKARVSAQAPARAAAPAGGSFKGKTVLFTGELAIARRLAEAWVKDQGGKVSSTVSKKTDWVVVGDAPGSKYDKARDLGIHIMMAAEFLRMMGRGK